MFKLSLPVNTAKLPHGWQLSINASVMESRKHKTLVLIVVLLTAGAVMLTVVLVRARWVSRHRITIGAIEDVVLLPWGVTLMARVDTGATTTALDAREIKELPAKKEIEFRLPEQCGGQLVRRRLRGWRQVTSSDGTSERRPVVNMEFQIGDRQFNAQVTLADRSRMKFPMLLGRNTLGNRYVVDVARTNLLSPQATEPVNP